MNEPTLFIVASPSGGGKSSLISALLRQDDGVRLSVSHTTRRPRPREEHGVHYYFVSESEFLELAGRDAFLEHAQVFDNHYGTGRDAVEKQLADGFDVLLDIDWQGARQVRKSFPSSRGIFILPPSMKVLRQRLTARGQDKADVIERRMRDARAEISHWDEFDFLVVNDDFELALEDLRSIVRSGKPAREDQEGRIHEILADFLETG
ncbi:MAG: guanylate kinase [Xanthomonadales bacterium]|nr:guanylate kinase [Xanthomonadales bacterium]